MQIYTSAFYLWGRHGPCPDPCVVAWRAAPRKWKYTSLQHGLRQLWLVHLYFNLISCYLSWNKHWPAPGEADLSAQQIWALVWLFTTALQRLPYGHKFGGRSSHKHLSGCGRVQDITAEGQVHTTHKSKWSQRCLFIANHSIVAIC